MPGPVLGAAAATIDVTVLLSKCIGAVSKATDMSPKAQVCPHKRHGTATPMAILCDLETSLPSLSLSCHWHSLILIIRQPAQSFLAS